MTLATIAVSLRQIATHHRVGAYATMERMLDELIDAVEREVEHDDPGGVYEEDYDAYIPVDEIDLIMLENIHDDLTNTLTTMQYVLAVMQEKGGSQ